MALTWGTSTHTAPEAAVAISGYPSLTCVDRITGWHSYPRIPCPFRIMPPQPMGDILCTDGRRWRHNGNLYPVSKFRYVLSGGATCRVSWKQIIVGELEYCDAPRPGIDTHARIASDKRHRMTGHLVQEFATFQNLLVCARRTKMALLIRKHFSGHALTKWHVSAPGVCYCAVNQSKNITCAVLIFATPCILLGINFINDDKRDY